jgi:GNAT superfamily N-acetyltransferase
MYQIIKATPADTDTIISIAHETWWPAYSSILPPEQIKFMLGEIYSEKKIGHQLKTGEQTFLLLKEGNEAVAFAAYSPREENPEIYKLHKLYCLPKTQGKGYGRVLINAVINEVIKAGKSTLDLNVNRHNKALTFYEKMGFTIAYKEDIPLGPYWMNDYVMRKTF